jgi:pyrroloquinoline quinone (PQQ) biosynthesis protein C
MRTHDLISAFDLAISEHRLLTHPYYRRWQDGLLTIDELGAYAEQYRHFERSLPGVLATTAECLSDVQTRRLVEDNLRDELAEPRPHAEIFEGFASAVGAKQKADATEATRNLVSLYETASSPDPVAALSVIGAYEIQAAQVALTKGESLRAHYGVGAAGTEFWDIHATLEETHAAWTIDALTALDADPSTVQKFASESSDAWWSFLDERDAAR